VRRSVVAVGFVLTAIVLGACGKDNGRVGLDRGARTTTATTARTSTKPVITPRSTKDGCGPVAAPVPRNGRVRKPRRRLHLERRYVAIVRTNCGTFEVKLDVRGFPKTTRSFVGLARAGFYDGLSFHQVAKPGGNDFLIQGGDPLGTGDGGPGFKVVERPPRSTRYPRLTVAMAKAKDEKAGTSGSQFFIVTGDGSGLDPLYARLGRVTHGGRAVRRIAAVPSDPVTESPIDPVIIKRVTIRVSRR
jgi:cyclophilin family peptidyl-prolyl cis-trans isomerase